MPALECVEVGRTAVVGWVDKRDWFLELCVSTLPPPHPSVKEIHPRGVIPTIKVTRCRG
jgi:hypothetical protein